MAFVPSRLLPARLNGSAHLKGRELQDGAPDPSAHKRPQTPPPTTGPREEQRRVERLGSARSGTRQSPPSPDGLVDQTSAGQSRTSTRDLRVKGDERLGTPRGALGPSDPALGHSAREGPGGGARSGQGTGEGKSGQARPQVGERVGSREHLGCSVGSDGPSPEGQSSQWPRFERTSVT